MSADRYSRHVLVPSIGKEGQRKLQHASILIIGGGALGSHTAEMCARMGIASMTIIDRDYVELSNLQRQTLFTEQDVAQKEAKAFALEKHLKKINSTIDIKGVVTDLTKDEMGHYVADADLVLDCTDNFDIRFLINEACILHEKKWIYASCAGTYGNIVPIQPEVTPCLDCLLSDTPFLNGASCDLIGVQTTLVPFITSIQCSIMVRMLIEEEDFDDYYFYQVDSWKLEMNKFNLSRKENCPSCVKKEYNYLHKPFSEEAMQLCGRDTVQFRTTIQNGTDFHQVADYLEQHAIPYKSNAFILSFTYENHPFTLFKDGRMLIHKVDSKEAAKKIYYQLFQ
ncbi:ThiF family adenylyltransferase [Alteribacillus iranensis]|uniref:Adenylyltransferase and sulfurtransferase n=1 Tax=Alteribacillus iranensis TaxID=930128 RepID=A0A1I2B9S2_9BACI|nr:ThiF family adenylyltransferase [Alteribacillus iranensis]SFE52895.1 adenylyltransferase and sulfurtransferase [Alteribacillus iranensis]